MGKIKRKKLSSFETKTLSELKELNDGGDKVYVPYIQHAYDNYKHEISECPQKLSAGENVQITDEGIVNAVDTCYRKGVNIEIDYPEGKISYVGDEPQTYAAGKGLRLISNNNNLALKLETDGGAIFTTLYGSKLHPTTFKNNYTLELAGNAMDSIFVHINESDRTGGYKVLCLENDAITLRTAFNARKTKKYYYTNGTASGWYQAQPAGYTKVNSSDYTNFVIDTENIELLSMSALFLQKHNNMEIVINIVNRTSPTYTDFVIENDTLYNAEAYVYEQGLLSSCPAINSNAYPNNNYGVIAKYEGSTVKTGFTAGHYVDTDGSGRSARPPFCGNVLSILDKTEDMYEDLYSTIRFIPVVSLDDTAQITTIKLVSTEY